MQVQAPASPAVTGDPMMQPNPTTPPQQSAQPQSSSAPGSAQPSASAAPAVPPPPPLDSTLAKRIKAAREVGTILRSLGLCPSEEQLRSWIKEVFLVYLQSCLREWSDTECASSQMEEEEPSGYVQFDKFSKVATNVIKNDNIVRFDEELLYRAFLTLDVEKKGFLTPDELRKFMTTEGEAFSQEEVEEMLNASTDPTNNRVYYEGSERIVVPFPRDCILFNIPMITDFVSFLHVESG
ncbi:Dynein regulatory complex protein 8 [Irineochytrium annulatum]|nr:Dynein regulatory complex protein 8 [Irineochytrium annulatum]